MKTRFTEEPIVTILREADRRPVSAVTVGFRICVSMTKKKR